MEPGSPAPAATPPAEPSRPESVASAPASEGAAEAPSGGRAVPEQGGGVAPEGRGPSHTEERSDGPPTDGGAAEAYDGQEGARLGRTQERRPRDMVLSLAVLIVPVALLLIFYRLVLNGDAPVTIDPYPTIQEARQANAFPVAAPQGLGDDWHPATATFTRGGTGATLRIGYVDPDKDPIQLVESSVPPDTLLPAELTESARPLGTFRSANGVWRLYSGRPGESGLVLAEQGRTIIVVGKTDVANLQELASALR